MSQYNHLIKYPYLLQFCQENQIPIEPYTHTYDQLILRDIVANPLPHFFERDYELRRAVINSCLQLGYNNRIMDADRVSRLKGNDSVRFWSTISEMKVGVWLEEQGIQIISFEPPSAKGGKGDFLIRGRGQEVFVEVKTVFGESYFLEQERVTKDIAQYCQDHQLPVEAVNLITYPRDYGYTNRKCTLLRAIGQLINDCLPLTKKRVISFTEASGIKMEIELNPRASLVRSTGYVGFSGLKDELRTRLNVGIISGGRKLQTSAKDIPSICIIDDLEHNMNNKFIIESVLFGNLVGDDTVSFYRKSDGKWSGQKPSELSSVFILNFVAGSPKVETLDAYLCPNPKYELSRLTFSEPNLTWRAIDKNGVHIEALNK